MRLVMNFTGQLQFWKRESERGWSLNWSEPNDRCSSYSICGKFGSCNRNDGTLCKCLPGFAPSNPGRWKSGNFSEGCLPMTEPCRRNYTEDVFLRMPMVKVSSGFRNETGVKNCTDACLMDCNCVAYSCGAADCLCSYNEACLRWFNELSDFKEDYPAGFTIFLRSTHSDIDLTSRGCHPCGTNSIPYPLSTSSDCGDPSYFNFRCNKKTGQAGNHHQNLLAIHLQIVRVDPILLVKGQETVRKGACVTQNFIGMDGI
ncbi:G-type lectin S-receptor-like serine/threonine-protein kinase At4g03230 isoform X2 [Amaranthus tricolor]|uniref:G-type lectin S-receptor-like serine/threonine-protein kinase At4g03230 isoform X2 n=1 Tax=Amaranthus tricolor TaxID=29722 RepID=UPI00258EC966|nr:G-type lectin S-receptor-like serine/threonine-protein kinase At4g03230 isoform X2 [Amaranthus tricolor]XP_057516325.1 G-type lectin S-receptor-like serine/threonine-protein kinase At4g03230 isoform X2 [Amaranthus tricolor]